MANPLDAVQRIYDAAGRELTGDVRAKMQRHLDANKQHTHGKPDYSLEKYDLDPVDLDARFQRYAPFHTTT